MKNFRVSPQLVKTAISKISLYIWLGLISLTLISAGIAESGYVSLLTTILVCAITLVKGRWVIDYFMGLKNATILTRRLVKSYFYFMTSIVGISAAYSQSLFHMN